uniref:MYB transcription factor n=1 Tax=Araucaria cunninghamii TaxID=56994 RepID=A0A0D6QZP2_ARACU
MGAPKQKWTSDEEGALRAGVDKYGPGKWRTIQKDPEFALRLKDRTNVDLKDKWRNMSVSASGQGSRERVRTPKKAVPAIPLQSLTPEATPCAIPIEATPPAVLENLVSTKTPTNGRTPMPRYDDMITEAITALRDPNGNDVASIASYIEERHEVPSNFRRLLSSKLRRLVTQDKIVKIRQNYKLKDQLSATEVKPAVLEPTNPADSLFQHPSITCDMMDASIDRINEASMAAAMKMADAEAKSVMAFEAAQESEYAERLAEESDMFFEAATAIFEKYLEDGIVVLNNEITSDL